MSLPSPNLDDRDWRQLMAAARQRIRELSPQWSDLSPNDPGIVLVEAFAYLTETLIYRLNRVPDKVYVELLNLLGVAPHAPHAASVELELRPAKDAAKDAAEGATRVPRGTRVTTATGAPIFRTLDEVQVAADGPPVRVRAVNAEVERLALVGTGTGRPGLAVQVPRPPLVRGPHGFDDLVVYVETTEPDAAADAQVDDRRFQRWREVADFASTAATDRVFIAERKSGIVRFAPALARDRVHPLDEPPPPGSALPPAEALGAVPPAGAQIRVTSLRGGGAAGNVLAATLTVALDPIGELEVTNTEAATGGADGEPLSHALARGPLSLRNPERAITALDYELAAQRCRGVVARARAFTQRDLWLHALPGTVEVVLVPTLPADRDAGAELDVGELEARQSKEGRARVEAELEARRPLGTRTVVTWAGYKTVRVLARIVVHGDREVDDVRTRIVRRLHRFLHPVSGGDGSGWRFGQSLHVSHVYEICLTEPGVVFVDSVRLAVADAPAGTVDVIAADTQPHVWYAGNERRLYRSLNDGVGWEPSAQLPEGHRVTLAAAHPLRHGCVALAAERDKGFAIRISHDCGGTWPIEVGVGYTVNGLAWTLRDGQPLLLLATDKGLASLEARGDAFPELVPGTPELELYAVAVSAPRDGMPAVALGTRHKGVWLSRENAGEGSFTKLGADDQDVRTLAFQTREGRTWLWAGVFVIGGGKGEGAIRWELGTTRAEPAKPAEPLGSGWSFGSCRGLAFVDDGRTVLAATSSGDVVALDSKSREPAWKRTSDDEGLPYFESGRKPIDSLAAQWSVDEDERGQRVRRDRVLVGGSFGIYRSLDGGKHFSAATQAEDIVTLPQTWLLASGHHQIDVVHERVREPSSRIVSSEDASR